MTTFTAPKACYKSIHIINKESITMINSHRTSILGALLFGTIVSSLLLPTPVQAIPQSSYQNSCKNIRINKDNLLSAKCRTQAGDYRNSSIRPQGIQNKNGVLNFTRLNIGSSYQGTCIGIHVDGVTLSARCKKNNGQLKDSLILIPGIRNINGDLTY
jgi:CVNH domain